MEKRLLWIVAMFVTLNVSGATPFEFDEVSLKLETLEPVKMLDYGASHAYWEEMELMQEAPAPVVEMPHDHSPFAKENWTWMRTNPDVKPYKFMDDLTFAGVPVFLAGIMSGELGYALSDLIFKGRGLLRGDALGERNIFYP